MRRYWQNKFAILSGASSGLGFHLALALAEHGARLALVGRDRGRLEKCRLATLDAGATQADVFSIDVADEVAWSEGLQDVSSFRSLCDAQPADLLINIVGASDRGLLESLAPADLISQFRVNVLSSFLMTNACLPSLKRAQGTVVNIAALSGILAGPGMGGYSMAKHALVGMHRQWRLELHDDKVHWMLVCPGPISRNETEGRYDALVTSRKLPPQTARPGAGVRLRSLDPSELAHRIIDAASRRETELIVPSKARWLAALMQVWPGWADRILRGRFQ
ncbi:MAG: SDR family NAD(P)-dependent oxidoreductase [Planctomycetota bacterium]